MTPVTETRLVATPLLAAGLHDPLPATGRPLRWGVIATGRIASIVVSDLALLPDAVLQAVSSRTQAGADAFAAEFGFVSAYGDLSDGGLSGHRRLLQDPSVDVVYIATPHANHYQVGLEALSAGKHVLCEKPLTLNARQAEHLVSVARDKGLFLMEAVWTRFLPSVQRAAGMIASGELGEVRWIQADLGFPAPYDPEARLWKLEDGGGALLDLGVYLLTWAQIALGQPQSLTATSALNSSGVDTETAMSLVYESGAQVQLMTSLTTVSTQTATLSGTKGTLKCNAPLFAPTELTITTGPGETRVEKFVLAGRGYTYQLRDVMRCIQQGMTESPTMPLADTLTIMSLLDEVRSQAGIRYPGD
ncbi:Gfo/Idh/MocA family protein [Pseudarthrobacter sp. S3]|uniref:Gfo/Idh/MocA family protein n=1 Tax=unclassified Pseudarthrobacter TaxID=2647000 RepID=UPI003CE7A621